MSENLNDLHTLLCVLPFELFNVLSFPEELPWSIRVLLEAAIRKCDGFYIKEEDVRNILDWKHQQNVAEVPFAPARVLFQDFT